MTARGYFVLQGGAEFSGEMAAVDRRALALAGGFDAAIDIIPAAAAPDGNHHRAGSRGVAWFNSLGARRVAYRLIVDHVSAQDLTLVHHLDSSRLVYLLGGFPDHLAQTLKGSPCWQSIKTMHREGGVISGSSAGAMVLCEHFYDPRTDQIRDGLNIMRQTCIIPHYNRVGGDWYNRLKTQLGEGILLGIDEQTGLINDVSSGGWTVYGAGCATIHHGDKRGVHEAGTMISYEKLPPPQVCISTQ